MTGSIEMGVDVALPDWIAEHRRQWARKAGLRAVYGKLFRRLREACTPAGSIVEIGCGPGFFKELYPEVVATDVVPNPFAEHVVDAAALPFADGDVGNVVALDVFHHLLRPEEFLREVARTLGPGGRLVMIEPWIGLAGRFFWRYVHHEDCDLRVDPSMPWGHDAKDPMQGNAALPYLYFRSRGHLEDMNLPLRIVRREPFAALPWLLSGGFQPVNPLPAMLVDVIERIDTALSIVPSITALRCLLVVERGHAR